MCSAFKRTISLLAVLALLIAVVPCAGAVFTFDETAAGTLADLGFIDGDGWLGGAPLTRGEAAVMLAKASGAQALPESFCVFSDVYGDSRGWIAAAAALGICAGQPDGTFAPDRAVSDRDFCTMLLRMLGYSDAAGDFTWYGAPEFAALLGIGDGLIESFTRADAAQLLYAALITRTAGGGPKLIEKLCAAGAVDRDALLKTPLAGYADCLKPIYDASEIFERCSAAVICVTSWKTPEDFEADKPASTSSAFFIDSEGTALMCYHQLEDCSVLRAETADGREYSVESVLWYDALRDLAVVKLEKTSVDGLAVRSFPYIPVCDSDALSVGQRIYTISNPLRLYYSMSEGIVAATDRPDLSEDYPVVQFTAAISSGSSGGPLITSHGEAAGVITAYYPAGNDLYLAVPINFATGAELFPVPMTPAEVAETEGAKKAASTITVSDEALTLAVGESRDVVCTFDCPSSVSLTYKIDDAWIVTCEWKEFSGKFTVPITVTGATAGETDVRITYTEGHGNPDAEAVIHVTVTE